MANNDFEPVPVTFLVAIASLAPTPVSWLVHHTDFKIFTLLDVGVSGPSQSVPRPYRMLPSYLAIASSQLCEFFSSLSFMKCNSFCLLI